MNRSESKYYNAAKKMHSAFITLLEEKEFMDISIMDICQMAGVNRSTFYAHYSNTSDLLKESFDFLIQNFLKECDFGSPIDISNMEKIDTNDLNFISPKYLLPYLKYIQAHKRLFKIYSNNSHIFETDDADKYLLDSLCIPICKKYGVSDKKLISYMQKFILKGIDAIIKEWVKNDCEDDILFICEIIIFCVKSNF